MSLYDRLSKAREGDPDVPTMPLGDEAPVAEAAPVHQDDPLDPLRRKLHQHLLEQMGPRVHELKLDAEELERRIRESLPEVLTMEKTPLPAAERQRLITDTLDDILGHGPIERYLNDPTVTEVMVNGPHSVFIERDGRVQPTDTRFLDDDHLRRTIEKIVGRVGRRIDESSPYVDARLPDGSRVNAVIPPVSIDGPMLTIRKFAATPYGVDDLLSFGTISQKAAEFLRSCVEGKLNILVSGGTGAGKTTTLNVLSSFIPDRERIITIEDAAELQLQQPHVVRLEHRPPNIEGRGEVTIRDLVRNALRMRPDRIVVGEVRGGEALDMLQAMNTGHDGSISTIHANSPRDILSRMETMVLMAGMDLPVRAIREQVSNGVQLIVHQSRLADGTRRFTHVTEITGMEGDIITLQDIYLFDYKKGRDESGRFLGNLKPTGLRPKVTDRLTDLGITLDPSLFDAEAPLAAVGS